MTMLVRAPWVVIAALILSAAAAPDTDYLHRDWGQVATLDMSLADATACIARTLDREGSVLVLPVDGGNDLDYSAGTIFGGSVNEPWAQFKIRGTAAPTELRILYRHPVNQKWLRRVMRNLGKRCLKIGSLKPV
jgi:hypothetical protein